MNKFRKEATHWQVHIYGPVNSSHEVTGSLFDPTSGDNG